MLTNESYDVEHTHPTDVALGPQHHGVVPQDSEKRGKLREKEEEKVGAERGRLLGHDYG